MPLERGEFEMKQYLTLKPEQMTDDAKAFAQHLCNQYPLAGVEMFGDDVKPRTLPLFSSQEEKQALVRQLGELQVKRLHASYWAYPTAFLTGNRFSELVERMGGEEEVRAYYGDLTGDHMMARWTQEYAVAAALEADSYVFHLIDYAPIDGMWAFSMDKQTILQAMIAMLQRFVNSLLSQELLTENSPVIELENAGWGLEHGVQTARDYACVLEQVYDPFRRLRVGWEVNHLLHAVGKMKDGSVRFFLPPEEVTSEMRRLEEKYGLEPQKFALEWLRYNLLHPKLWGKVAAVHLSDCKWKTSEYFRNGLLAQPWLAEMQKLNNWEAREEYGVKIVLGEYDSHEVLGDGALNGSDMAVLLAQLEEKNQGLMLLHELKNSVPVEPALQRQLAALKGEH